MSDGLPSYVAMAKPNPMSNRAPWYKNTAPTYAGIFLWFVFWSGFGAGSLGAGIGAALLGLLLAAVICHTLFYLVPGMLGMQTGLPLYIVGTSTYGTQGGFLMPGFLMGLLQFGWLGVNAYFSALAILGIDPLSLAGKSVPVHAMIVMIAWGCLAAFMGLKGIQYVARVATYLPLIPLAVLLILFVRSAGGLGSFESAKVGSAGFLTVLGAIITGVVGFFATAGAAGVDFGMNNRNEKDVQMGGIVGIAGATIVTAGLSILIAAGATGKGISAGNTADVKFMGLVVGSKTVGQVMGVLLALAAFPPACFSSFIAANSFKTTLPKVNPFVSVGLGTLVSIVLAVTGAAGRLGDVFGLIGASFGPICGAMMVDYLLSGKKWAGPRAGWNLAGWISWALGFLVGIAPLPIVGWLHYQLGPVYAFIVGAAVYFLLAKAGLEPPVVPMEGAKEEAAAAR